MENYILFIACCLIKTEDLKSLLVKLYPIVSELANKPIQSTK